MSYWFFEQDKPMPCWIPKTNQHFTNYITIDHINTTNQCHCGNIYHHDIGRIPILLLWFAMAFTDALITKMRRRLSMNIHAFQFALAHCLRYKLHLGGYSGDVFDGFTVSFPHRNINGMNFSTFDNDNDLGTSVDCPSADASGDGHGAGWWYNSCAVGEPNGAGYYFRWFYNTTAGIVLQTSRMMVKLVDP